MIRPQREAVFNSTVIGLLVAVLMLLLLTACDTLQLQKPQSLEDQLRYGQTTIGSAYRTLGDVVTAGTVSKAEGEKIYRQLDGLERDLSLVDSLIKGGKPVDAEAKLRVTMNALLILRGELIKKNGGKP